MYHCIICFLLFLSLILNTSSNQILLGEKGLIEITQLLLLTLGIVLNIHFRKLLLKEFSKWLVYIKTIFFLLVLYEEISIITTDLFNFLSAYNHQSELNLHNAIILKEPILSFAIFNNDTISIIPITFITLGLLLFVGFGSYFKSMDRFSFLFFQKKYSLYVLIYPLNFVFSYILRPFTTLNNGFLLDQEYVELILYLIIIFDTLDKIKYIRLKNLRNL